VGVERDGPSTNTAGVKRTGSQAGVSSLPPRKHARLASPTKAGSDDSLPNRVHRQVILRKFGKPIYKIIWCAALLGALEGCIEGHASLHKAGLLHRDISINNLMINEDADNPSWPSFLIDLDLAVRNSPGSTASAATGKTGTRAFMAAEALFGKPRSFMHDLELFFWVLFCIYVHYDGLNENSRVVLMFERWNYAVTEMLALQK
jgi:serine/threonine protein kinase